MRKKVLVTLALLLVAMVTMGQIAYRTGYIANPFGTAAGQGGFLYLRELAANGANYIGLRAPDDVAANKVFILPAADGTNNQVLATDGSLGLHWHTVGGDGAEFYFPAARCQGASATSFWNLPNAATAAAAACTNGTNLDRAVLNYVDGGSHFAMVPHHLIDEFDAAKATSLNLYWSTSATTGDVKWNVSTVCVGADEDPDPAFNAAQTITQTALGNANRKTKGSIATLTMTGCAADETLFIKVERDGTADGDTIAATAALWAVELKYFRIW